MRSHDRDVCERGFDHWYWAGHPKSIENGIDPFRHADPFGDPDYVLSELRSAKVLYGRLAERTADGEHGWCYQELVEDTELLLHEAELTNAIVALMAIERLFGHGVMLCDRGPNATMARHHILHTFWIADDETTIGKAHREIEARMAARGFIISHPRKVERVPRAPRVPKIEAVNVRADVWDKTHGRCWYCGVYMHPFRNYHVDHVIPRIDGGSDDMANLVPACEACNTRKGGRPAEFLRRYFGDGKFWAEREGLA